MGESNMEELSPAMKRMCNIIAGAICAAVLAELVVAVIMMPSH
jgi:hypothetical protein